MTDGSCCGPATRVTLIDQAGFLLDERYLCSVEVDALNVGLSRQNADVLPERLLFDHDTEAFADIVPHQVEWQPPSQNALIDSHNVEAITRLDQLAQQASGSQ